MNKLNLLLLLVFLVVGGMLAVKYLVSEPAKVEKAPGAGAAAEDELTEAVPAKADRRISAPDLEFEALNEGLPARGVWRGKPVLIDLDHDGDLDIVCGLRKWDNSSFGEGIHVFLNDGKGNWTEKVDGLRRDLGYGGSDVADVNGDGNLDIAYSGHDVPTHIFLSDGKGNWSQPASQPEVPAVCIDVALGDLNGDGILDLAAMGMFPGKGGFFVYMGKGDGTFHERIDLFDRHGFGSQVEIVDIEGDGKNEMVAVTSHGTKVWRWNGTELVEDAEGLPGTDVGGSELGLEVEDLDGDGVREILIGSIHPAHAPLRIFKLVDGKWTPWGDLPEIGACYDVCFARLAKDARLSIVAASQSGLIVLDQPSEGRFEVRGRLIETKTTYNVTAGDVDGDGIDEILAVCSGGPKVFDLAD